MNDESATCQISNNSTHLQGINDLMRVQPPQPQRMCIPPSNGSTAYYPSVYSNIESHIYHSSTITSIKLFKPQQFPKIIQPMLKHRQQLCSPIINRKSLPVHHSNPGTPHQMYSNNNTNNTGEFNGTAEFGVPYHHGAPSSVNSLTDALCPNGGLDTTDRQMTPGPPVNILSFSMLL